MTVAVPHKTAMLEAVDELHTVGSLCRALDLALEAAGGEDEAALRQLLFVISVKLEITERALDASRQGEPS